MQEGRFFVFNLLLGSGIKLKALADGAVLIAAF